MPIRGKYSRPPILDCLVVGPSVSKCPTAIGCRGSVDGQSTSFLTMTVADAIVIVVEHSNTRLWATRVYPALTTKSLANPAPRRPRALNTAHSSQNTTRTTFSPSPDNQLNYDDLQEHQELLRGPPLIHWMHRAH